MSTTDEVIGSIDHALHDFDTSDDAMRWTPNPVQPALDPRQVRAGIQAIGLAWGEVVNAYARAMTKAFGHLGRMVAKYGHALGKPNHNPVRCRLCRPYANPVPLRHGPAYRARARRRTRSHR